MMPSAPARTLVGNSSANSGPTPPQLPSPRPSKKITVYSSAGWPADDAPPDRDHREARGLEHRERAVARAPAETIGGSGQTRGSRAAARRGRPRAGTPRRRARSRGRRDSTSAARCSSASRPPSRTSSGRTRGAVARAAPGENSTASSFKCPWRVLASGARATDPTPACSGAPRSRSARAAPTG